MVLVRDCLLALSRLYCRSGPVAKAIELLFVAWQIRSAIVTLHREPLRTRRVLFHEDEQDRAHQQIILGIGSDARATKEL
jgi:hypothetical protein